MEQAAVQLLYLLFIINTWNLNVCDSIVDLRKDKFINYIIFLRKCYEIKFSNILSNIFIIKLRKMVTSVTVALKFIIII